MMYNVFVVFQECNAKNRVFPFGSTRFYYICSVFSNLFF